jgi:hypothetical protein
MSSTWTLTLLFFRSDTTDPIDSYDRLHACQPAIFSSSLHRITFHPRHPTHIIATKDRHCRVRHTATRIGYVVALYLAKSGAAFKTTRAFGPREYTADQHQQELKRPTQARKIRIVEGTAMRVSFASMMCQWRDPRKTKDVKCVKRVLQSTRPVMAKMRMLRQLIPIGGVFQRIKEPMMEDVTNGAAARKKMLRWLRS